MAIRFSCGSTKQEAAPKANTENYYGFALGITNLQSFSAGTRIATPVCTLVRNDMLKTVTRLRVQERLARKVRKNMPGVSRGRALGCGDISPTVIARSGATGQSVTPAVAQSRKQRLRRIRKITTDLP